MSWRGKCVAEEEACLVVPREQKQSGGGVRINQLIRQMCTVISLITVFMDDTVPRAHTQGPTFCFHHLSAAHQVINPYVSAAVVQSHPKDTISEHTCVRDQVFNT